MTGQMTAAQATRLIAARLAAVGVDNPRLEARLLLAHAMGSDVAALLREPDNAVSLDVFDPVVRRREGREPLAYILGHREFWSLDFAVSPATLIPRADSETLVEAALSALSGRSAGRVLDLGTGTGCLLLTILHLYPDAFGVGVDLSPAAAALAARNAVALGLHDRAGFLCGNWAAALGGPFDLILANPPYIESGAIPGLMPDVADFEPALALDGGSDGFDAYRQIMPDLPRLLAPGGVAVLELGAGQAEIACRMAVAHGLRGEVHADLAGIARAIVLRGSPA